MELFFIAAVAVIVGLYVPRGFLFSSTSGHGLPNRQPKWLPSGLVWSRLVWKAGWGTWHVIHSPADRGGSSLTPRPWAVDLPLPRAELCPCAHNEENIFSPDNSSCPHELYVNPDVLESFKTQLFRIMFHISIVGGHPASICSSPAEVVQLCPVLGGCTHRSGGLQKRGGGVCCKEWELVEWWWWARV